MSLGRAVRGSIIALVVAVGMTAQTGTAFGQSVVDDNPAAVSGGMGNMSIAVRGPDGNLWASGWNGTTWNPWSRLAGMNLTSGPALSLRPGITDAFARGVNNEIFHRYYANGTWSQWGSIGGCAASAPAASFRSNVGSIDVVMRGCDGAVWFKTWTQNNGWSAWVTLNGTSKYAPAIKSYASGQIDIFAVNNTGEMVSRTFYNGAWTGWAGLGGEFTAAPAVTSQQPGRVDVFGRSTDNRILQKSWLGSGWSAWVPIETVATSGPAAAAEGVGRVSLFVRGGTMLYQNQFVTSSWTGWRNDWSLAGITAPDFYRTSWQYGGVNGAIDSQSEALAAASAYAALPASQIDGFLAGIAPGDEAWRPTVVAQRRVADAIAQGETAVSALANEVRLTANQPLLDALMESMTMQASEVLDTPIATAAGNRRCKSAAWTYEIRLRGVNTKVAWVRPKIVQWCWNSSATEITDFEEDSGRWSTAPYCWKEARVDKTWIPSNGRKARSYRVTATLGVETILAGCRLGKTYVAGITYQAGGAWNKVW